MTPSEVDTWQRAGLYDPASPHAATRLELLRWIDGLGFSLEQMLAAAQRRQLASLPADTAVRPGTPRRSMREVAGLLGTTVEALAATRRASGLPPIDPDEAALTPSDVTMLSSFVDAGQVFSEDELLHFTRVVGTSMRRIAEAAGEMFIYDVEAPIVRDLHDNEAVIGRKSLEAMQMVQSAIAVFEPMFRAHLEQSIQTSRDARAGSTELATMPLAIGFVDLSGFTTQSAQLPPAELLDLVLQFESIACDLVADHGGRVVKLIGDEVMFTTVDATSACHIASALVRDVGASTGSRPRGGIGFGRVVAHGGDLYGDTVNRASRMADLAVPGEVLVDRAVVDHVAPGSSVSFEPAGRRSLKGFGEPVALWSIAG